MAKLDTTSGLSAMQIGTIKYKIKQAVGLSLPELPEHVEIMLFFQGRDAWTYSWCLLAQDAQDPRHPVAIEVEAKLKKEFMQYQPRTRYAFVCRLRLRPDLHAEKVSIREKKV